MRYDSLPAGVRQKVVKIKIDRQFWWEPFRLSGHTRGASIMAAREPRRLVGLHVASIWREPRMLDRTPPLQYEFNSIIIIQYNVALSREEYALIDLSMIIKNSYCTKIE